MFAPVLGRLSDKHGRRPVLLVSLLGTALGFFILGFATTLWMLFVGRIIDGISGGNISTAQAYIADVTTKENRAKGMGLIGAAFGLGFVFGPAIGGILSRWGINVPFLFAGGLALANTVLLYFALPETVTPDHPARVSAASGRGWHQLLAALQPSRNIFSGKNSPTRGANNVPREPASCLLAEKTGRFVRAGIAIGRQP